DERRGGGRERRQERVRGYGETQEQPVEDSPEKRLATLLIVLGDKMTPEEIHKNIEKFAGVILEEYSKYETHILKTFKNCFMELSTKSSIYGTLAGLMNAKRSDIGAAIVKMTSQTLQQCLYEGNWRGAKLALKFFAELTNANVILPRTMLDIYDDLLITLDESNVKMCRADTIIYIILSTLPYVAMRLRERSPVVLDSVLSKIERYVETRERIIMEINGSAVLQSVTPYVRIGVPYEQQDMLELLWIQIQNLKQNDWVCSILLKPWSEYDSILVTADQHEVDKFIVPEHSHGINYYPVPLFRIFVGLEDESMIDLHQPSEISFFLVRDNIEDIIEIYEINRKECTKYLKELPYNFAPGTFVDKDTTLSATKTEVKNEPEIKEEPDIKIEPDDTFSSGWGDDNSTESKPMLSVDKANGFRLEQIIVEAIGILFDRLDFMDVECCYRFWNWFSHHLSNFGFVWNWKDWENTLQLDPLHPKVCFIRETLEKAVRYSYYDRIRTSIPDEFLVVFPSSEPSTNFRYEDKEHPLYNLSTNMISKLRTKSPNSEIQSVLDEVGKNFPEMPQLEREHSIRDLFTQCVLMLGSKSFSHVLNVIERYLPILQSLNETFEARVHTVKIVSEFWVNNTQFLGILLDKLLNYRVIDAIAVIYWLLTDEMEKDIARSYTWEIMKNTINKVISRVKQVAVKLESVLKPGSENVGQGVDITSEESKKVNLDEIQNLENTLNMVTREQKEVLLKVFQLCISRLENKLTDYSNQGIQDPMAQPWFWWAYGFFREIARTYQPQISTFMVTLETVVLTPGSNPNITNVIEMVKLLSKFSDATVENDFS
ncbi:2780_t:CDS:10, partial [Acaulospora morrowiae]